MIDDSYFNTLRDELREIYDKSHKQDKRIVIIEDNIGVLQDIENLHNDRIKCYLVSDFI